MQFLNEAGQRLKSETPKFWQTVGKIGVVLTSISGAILVAPVALPAALLTAAGYMATAGAVAAAISKFGAHTQPENTPEP